jgi:1A family penicillin-binding protein
MSFPPDEPTAAPGADPTGGHRPRSRTAAAGREFVTAIGSDLRIATQRLRDSIGERFSAWRQRRDAEPDPGEARAREAATRSDLRVLRRFAIGLSLVFIAGFLAFTGAMMWALHDLPLDRPRTELDQPALLIEAANGEPLGRVGPLKVEAMPLKAFPERLVEAVLSIEDRRFYSHFGVDPFGIARAMQRNLEAGEIVEGGSTITQQLVKIQMLNGDRTYTRKLREAMTAIWLEMRVSKEEILTRYLNSIYMGAGARGMPAAARLYFDKAPSELTLAEAAMLAGLIRAPSYYSPLRNLDTAQARAETVIDAMVETGAITEEEAAAAKAEPATLAFAADVSQAQSWFAGWVAKEATDVTSSFTGTLRVRTTLVPGLQELAGEVVQSALAEEGGRANASQAALVALRPDGAVLAMVGGRSYEKSQFNRATEANRQPGSAFKLFVYLAALRAGFSPNDVIDARAVEIKNWKPENFGDRNYDRMPVADAFAQSVNTAAVRLAMQVGLKEVIKAARDLGIDAELPSVPSIALGAAEVSLLDMTGAFASLQAGRLLEPWGVAAFGAEKDKQLRGVQPLPQAGREIGQQQQTMIDLLRLVVERGTGRAAALDGFAAGKTGTSQNHRDAWFVGFNQSLIVGVWVGNDDGTPMERVVGGGLPATIWKRFMVGAGPLLGKEKAPQPKPQEQPQTVETKPSELEQKLRTVEAGMGIAPAAREAGGQASASCDARACAAAYRSFRASDCTYQPYDGERRICDLAGGSTTPRAQISRASTNGRSNGGSCNVEVCSRFYSSFDAADCTYQPYGGGPRQICDR